MKKILSLILLLLFTTPLCFAKDEVNKNSFKNFKDNYQIKSLLKSQVRYANKNNFNKFIGTYDKNYTNADGFNIETYSELIKDIWKTFDDIKYDIVIKSININDDSAVVNLEELSYAYIPVSEQMSGILKSNAESKYYLKKINNKWKVYSDEVINETTSMLYGEAKNLNIKLITPEYIESGKEYSALLEFTPPKNTMAIASIAKDKIEYPQKQVKEVFRRLPDDNILERLFISNTDNTNEYVMASIGLTKTDICDLSIKLSLTGFGYHIKRVNVINNGELSKGDINVKK